VQLVGKSTPLVLYALNAKQNSNKKEMIMRWKATISGLTALFLCTLPLHATAQTISMKVTGFTLTKKECGGNIQKTALMTTPVPGRTAAVSRDLLHLLGKRVYIEGLGVWKVESVASKRLKNTLDLLVPTKGHAMKIGNRKRKVVVL